MKRRLMVGLIGLALAACGKGGSGQEGTPSPVAAPTAAAASPEQVAEQYLRHGGAGGDLAKARALVAPSCQDAKVRDVDAVCMLGARMTISGVKATVKDKTDDRATVAVEVSGSMDSKGSETKTELLGGEVKLEVGSLQVGSMTQSTTLSLEKVDGQWRVSCP